MTVCVKILAAFPHLFFLNPRLTQTAVELPEIICQTVSKLAIFEGVFHDTFLLKVNN